MLSIKNKFQIFIPILEHPDLSTLNPPYIEKYSRKTGRLINILSTKRSASVDFVAADMNLKYRKGTIYTEDNRLVGGWFKLNPYITDFLSLYNFPNISLPIFNQELLTPRAQKFFNGVFMGLSPSFLHSSLFNMLINQDLRPLINALPQEMIEGIVNKWASELELVEGSWEYDAANGVQFKKTVEETVAELRGEAPENPPIIVAEGVPLDLTVTPDDRITITTADDFITTFLEHITNG